MSARILGGLLVVAFLHLGCSDNGAAKPDTNGRSDVVLGSSAGTASTAKASGVASAKPPSPPHKLCASPPTADGKKLPSVELGHVEADGTTALEGAIETGGGQWTWLNLWAGYCGPCKQEVPLLFKWRADLAKAKTPIHLAFLSLDDDDRQAKKFLDAQPQDGLRASFFLPEGKQRATFLKDLGLKDPTELPVHVLVDPSGAVRCVIQGAIEATDYQQVTEIVSKR